MIGLGVIGAVFGSFIATLAIRWPAGRSALRGRSKCDGCGRTLRAWELVPIASWIAARGHCATCGGRIAIAHPLTELAGAAIGVAAAWLAPGVEGLAGAAFGWLLLTLAAIDLAALWLPNVLTAILAAAGLASAAYGFSPAWPDRLIGGPIGFAVLWGVARLYRVLRGREGLGGGDAKLFGAIGLWLGWRALPPVLLIACAIGLATVCAMALAGRRVAGTDRLPLGTLLAAGAFAMWMAPRL